MQAGRRFKRYLTDKERARPAHTAGASPPDARPPQSAMKRPLQRHRVLQYAIARGAEGFTRRDAAYYVGCYELASRIGELEAEGVTFKRASESGRNMWGDPVRWTRYEYVSAPREVLRMLPEGADDAEA